MRKTTMAAAGLLAALPLTITGATATAAPPTTYDGVFDGPVVFDNCVPAQPAATASGSWSVTLHGRSAKADFDLWSNGEPHAVYTFPGMKQLDPPAGTTFVLEGRMNVGTLTVTLTDAGAFTYHVEPFLGYDVTCDSLTYPGHLTD